MLGYRMLAMWLAAAEWLTKDRQIKCELDSLHASEAWDEGRLEWESYQFGRTVFSTSAGIEHELE